MNAKHLKRKVAAVKAAELIKREIMNPAKEKMSKVVSFSERKREYVYIPPGKVIDFKEEMYKAIVRAKFSKESIARAEKVVPSILHIMTPDDVAFYKRLYGF